MRTCFLGGVTVVCNTLMHSLSCEHDETGITELGDHGVRDEAPEAGQLVKLRNKIRKTFINT